MSMLIVVLVVSNFFLLGTSRLRALIRIAAFEGLVLGLFPFFTQAEGFSFHTVIIGAGGMLLKGVAIPLLLYRALRGVEAYREEKPRVGYTTSIAAGIAISVLAFWIGAALPRSPLFPNPQVVSLALCLAAVGLFLIIARTETISQIVGYLMLENGIYTFGISLSAQQSVLVEMGVLLDLLVGVFIMCIVIYHINRQFESINTEELEVLKE
jgi:hydrogenase-4 component E